MSETTATPGATAVVPSKLSAGTLLSAALAVAVAQIGLSIPMYALYEFSIFAVKWVEKQRAAREAAAAKA